MSYSFNYPSEIQEARKKRTFEIPELLKSKIDSGKLLFPKGILSKVRESHDDVPPVKRIELFAKDGAETYGIIRSLFVGFSSEKSVLQIAEISGGVVQVRAVRARKGPSKEFSSDESSGDVLLLKRSPAETSEQSTSTRFRFRIPSVTVPAVWKERMKLSEEDRLLISNPIGEYAVPPPSV